MCAFLLVLVIETKLKDALDNHDKAILQVKSPPKTRLQSFNEPHL